jgi:PelA/Pel-15E family pectate lyase
MRKATYARGFEYDPSLGDDWFRSDSGRAAADAMLTWQTPAGGWTKRTEMRRPRQPGESWYAESDEWHYIGTIDNGATTGQLRFLARAARATGEPRYADAVRRGIDYLLTAQFPNGCWPQVYPLQGGYSDAATYNDDAIVNVLELLGDVAREGTDVGRAATPAQRERATAAVRRGIDCVLASQVMVKGTPTVWAQQHDPLTLAPTHARSYELGGLSGRESASILTYLISLPDPDARVQRAVRAAAEYFRRHAIMGYAYGADQVLRAEPGAGPIWARLVEIGTDRPIFANRDGIKLYDWSQLTDRRSGYAWFGTEPGSALEKYAKWERRLERASERRVKVRKP